MGQGWWPHADTPGRWALLMTGAATGFLGALVAVLGQSAVAYLGAGLVALFAVSLASAEHHLSPRLAALAPWPLALGALLIVPTTGPVWSAQGVLGHMLAWIGVGVLSLSLWYDRRRTYGLAGLGIMASAFGAATMTLDLLVPFHENVIVAATAAGVPAGSAPWSWLVLPWGAASVATSIWMMGTGAWLLVVHNKEFEATRLRQKPPVAGPRP